MLFAFSSRRIRGSEVTGQDLHARTEDGSSDRRRDDLVISDSKDDRAGTAD